VQRGRGVSVIRHRRPPRDLPLLVLSLALLVTSLIGLTAGSSQVTLGTVENGQGAYVSEQALTYWPWAGTVLAPVPTPVPVMPSTNPAAPTLLGAGGRSYVLDAATAGAEGVRWQFSELTTAPRHTELELRFLVGTSAATSAIRIYVETRGFAPIRTLTYFFYWDAGAFPPTSLTIATEQATVLACAAIGTCP
jgi:hypothetical protein